LRFKVKLAEKTYSFTLVCVYLEVMVSADQERKIIATLSPSEGPGSLRIGKVEAPGAALHRKQASGVRSDLPEIAIKR